jgi:hypothetical protein
MSQHIQQLADRAKKSVPHGLSPDKWVEFYNLKFAELVILECASRVRFTDLLKCNDDSDGEILLQASVQLKQHFGVEE